MNSLRGNLILSQALHYAIQVMKQERHLEWSNIEDMEMMREEIFMFPILEHGEGAAGVAKAMESMQKMQDTLPEVPEDSSGSFTKTK